MFYWGMLLLAITTEVFSTSIMKLTANEYSLTRYLFFFIMIGLSYFFLSKAVLKIPLGIAYAIWEGLGIAAITVISYFIFQETLNINKLLGITAIILGVCLMQIRSSLHE